MVNDYDDGSEGKEKSSLIERIRLAKTGEDAVRGEGAKKRAKERAERQEEVATGKAENAPPAGGPEERGDARPAEPDVEIGEGAERGKIRREHEKEKKHHSGSIEGGY